jgi:serine-type D-Ala-D-Ala carboxypeptidase (penicillin-binding protein 5/6)
LQKYNYKLISFLFFDLGILCFGIFFFLNLEKKQNNGIAFYASEKGKVLGATLVKARGENLTSEFIEKTSSVNDSAFTNVSAKAFLVYDEKSNQNLALKNQTLKLPIASLTKLLTALVVYKEVDLMDKVVISSSDKFAVEPSLNLKSGDTVLVRDLFDSMLIGSANDAGITLANFVEKKTGKNFVELMNLKAKELSMENSKFSNPIGFDSKDNFSTVDDLKKLVIETQKYSAFVSLGKKTGYTFSSEQNNSYSVKATNKLVFKHTEFESIKTGFTQESAGSLISKVENDSNKIVIIVIGSENREKDTLDIKNEIFKTFTWKQF